MALPASAATFFLRERDAAKGQVGFWLPLLWQLAAGATSAVGEDWRPRNSNHRLSYPEAHCSVDRMAVKCCVASNSSFLY